MKNEKTIKNLFLKYKKEICNNCISENCEEGIIVQLEKDETICARCIDYKYKNENKIKSNPGVWQPW